MLRLVVLCALFSGVAFALPGEDHWSVDPESPFAQDYNKAKAMIEAENFADALPILTRLAEVDSANANVFNLLGFAYRKTGDLQRSAPAYERALLLNPDHLSALEYQGELFLAVGDVDAADRNLTRLTTLCPSPCEETDELAEAIATWRDGQ